MAPKHIFHLLKWEKLPDILPRGNVYIIDENQESEYTFSVREGTECHLLRLGLTGTTSTKICTEIEPNGICTIDGIFLAEKTNVHMETSIAWDNAFGKVELLCLARQKTDMKISANMSVVPWIRWFSAHVRQQNILLWGDATIRGIPMLHVASNEGNIWHSCTVTRIPKEHIFYLASHGMDRESADALILEWLIRKRLQCFTETEIYSTLQEKIMRTLAEIS